jgi:hypothetical protein
LPSPTSCSASSRLSAIGLIPPVSASLLRLAGSPQILEGVFPACRRLLHRRAQQVLFAQFSPLLVSGFAHRTGARHSFPTALPVIPAVSPFTMLAVVRRPTACAFALPLWLATSHPLCPALGVLQSVFSPFPGSASGTGHSSTMAGGLPFSRLCHPALPSRSPVTALGSGYRPELGNWPGQNLPLTTPPSVLTG